MKPTDLYFRVKRIGRFETVSLENMTKEEREVTLAGKDNAFLLDVITILLESRSKTIHATNELFDKPDISGAVIPTNVTEQPPERPAKEPVTDGPDLKLVDTAAVKENQEQAHEDASSKDEDGDGDGEAEDPDPVEPVDHEKPAPRTRKRKG